MTGPARSNREPLTQRGELFALDFLANGYNATAAYKATHPRCAQRTAEVNGSRLLRKAEVSAFIESEKRERNTRYDGRRGFVTELQIRETSTASTRQVLAELSS